MPQVPSSAFWYKPPHFCCVLQLLQCLRIHDKKGTKWETLSNFVFFCFSFLNVNPHFPFFPLPPPLESLACRSNIELVDNFFSLSAFLSRPIFCPSLYINSCLAVQSILRLYFQQREIIASHWSQHYIWPLLNNIFRARSWQIRGRSREGIKSISIAFDLYISFQGRPKEPAI